MSENETDHNNENGLKRAWIWLCGSHPQMLRDKGPLFEEVIELNAYPPEYIFAEKLEAIIYLDDINGRMKDFHDCIRMI